MSNAFTTNFLLNSSNEKFSGVWKLTRTLLAAGWKYLAGSNAIAKDTTGVEINDTWQMGGYTNLTSVGGAQSGATASVTAVTNGFATVTFSGTSFAAASIGRALTLSGAINGGNNGTFRISAVASGTSITIYNTAAVVENTGAITFAEKFGGGAASVVTTVGTGSTASLTTVTNGVQTVTGVTGMVATSVGHTLTITGAASGANNGTFIIVTFISATSVGIFNPLAVANDANNGSISWADKVPPGTALVTGLTGLVTPTALPGSNGHRLTFTGAASGGNNGTFMIVATPSATTALIRNANAVGGDANNGSIGWTEWDPISSSYPASIAGATGTGAWILLQGPSTLKIPIGTAVLSPTFTRGENITQLSTGATGELLGVVTDATTGLGFMVVAPRLNGTGAGVRGWSNSASIRAAPSPAGSGASVTPSGTIVEYVRQFVWWKNSTTAGHIYTQTIDPVTEGTPGQFIGQFSQQATLAGCTATICPGGATGLPSVNGFPVIGTWVFVGTGGSNAATTGSADFTMNASSVTTGKAQILCANCIEGVNTSPDGSWIFAIGTPSNATTSFLGNAWCRCDDTEEGDVDPYVGWFDCNLGTYARSRTAVTSTITSADLWVSGGFGASINTPFVGWRRRGFPTADAFQEFGGYFLGNNSGIQLMATNTADPDKVACSVTTVRVREPWWVISIQTGQRMRKGTLRWIYSIQGGNGTDTYDSKRWIQLSSVVNWSVVVGPYDQTTTPVNS